MSKLRSFVLRFGLTPPIDPTIVDKRIIISVKLLISIRNDMNINGAAFYTLISNAQFSHLNPSITLENHRTLPNTDQTHDKHQ